MSFKIFLYLCTSKKENEDEMNKTEEKNHSWGGRREGAGRKKTNPRSVSVLVPKEMADYLDTLPNKSGFIKESIRLMMKLREAESKMIPATHFEEVYVNLTNAGVAAGSPIWTDNHTAPEEAGMVSMLSTKKENCVFLKVHGTSMIEAGIDDGDLASIDVTVRDVPEDKIALCMLNGELTLKHVRRNPDGSISLVPRNKDMKPIDVTPNDHFVIQGKLVKVLKNFE